MKRYSYLHALVLSFFSKSFYQDVGRNWRGIGYLYLAILLAVLWIPTMIKLHTGFGRFVRNEAPPYTQQIPEITITNGKVSTDVPTPYFIKNPADGTPVAIIDTTGEYKSLDDTPARILLTESKVIARSNRDTRIYDLTPVESFYLDRERVEGWLGTAKTWLALVAYPVLLLGSFVFRAIQVLIYALIGMLFARMLHVTLAYKSLMRLAAVALTPILLLNLLLEFVPLRIPVWWLIGTVIGLGYLFFAVKSNSEFPPMAAPPSPPPPPPLVVYPASQT